MPHFEEMYLELNYKKYWRNIMSINIVTKGNDNKDMKLNSSPSLPKNVTKLNCNLFIVV